MATVSTLNKYRIPLCLSIWKTMKTLKKVNINFKFSFFISNRWSELEEAPVVGQWEPFRVTASTTSADDLPK